ncbi:MAG: hypothetical protein R3D58_13475 [Saprospiraceae bacterium]|nr:hypothetical protein [Lewinellaceae bacterium]
MQKSIALTLGILFFNFLACNKSGQISFVELIGTWEQQIIGWECSLGCTLHDFTFEETGMFKLKIKRSVDVGGNAPCSPHRISFVQGQFEIDDDVIHLKGKFMHESYQWPEPDCEEGPDYRHSTGYTYKDGILILNSGQNFSDKIHLKKI